MLTELRLTNFRIFDDEITVRFRPITVLIGRNSSGKSSIIKFLLMLQQSLDLGRSQFLTAEGEKVDLGLFSDLKNTNSSKRNLKFEFSVEDIADEPEFPISQYLSIIGTSNYGKLVYKAGGSVSYSSRSSMARADFIVMDRVSGKNLIRVSPPNLDDSRFWDRPSPSAPYNSDSINGSLGKSANDHGRYDRNVDRRFMPLRRWVAETTIIDTVSHQISSSRHLLPVRDESQRVIVTTSWPRDDVGQTGRFALPHLHEIIRHHPDKYKFILPHLKNIAGISDVKFDTSSRYIARAMGINRITGAEVPIADFGFGVGQCLPIIVQGAIMDPYTTLMVEQPEAQLHPTAQLELGSYFADLWKQRKVASIIETHSDNILLRLRRLIAKGDLSHEDVSVAYFTFDEENRNMPIIKNLDINEDGSMEAGLPMEFFGADVIEGLKLGARA